MAGTDRESGRNTLYLRRNHNHKNRIPKEIKTTCCIQAGSRQAFQGFRTDGRTSWLAVVSPYENTLRHSLSTWTRQTTIKNLPDLKDFFRGDEGHTNSFYFLTKKSLKKTSGKKSTINIYRMINVCVAQVACWSGKTPIMSSQQWWQRPRPYVKGTQTLTGSKRQVQIRIRLLVDSPLLHLKTLMLSIRDSFFSQRFFSNK